MKKQTKKKKSNHGECSGIKCSRHFILPKKQLAHYIEVPKATNEHVESNSFQIFVLNFVLQSK